MARLALAVTDVVIQDNIFFNDFVGSGRANNNDTGSFIVIKDMRAAFGVKGGKNITFSSIVLPRWDGTSFASGNTSIRQEFERLVNAYGAIPNTSPAIAKADPAFAPADDILGRPRSATPDLGAYEKHLLLSGTSGLTTIWLAWSDPQEPSAASLAITYTTGTTSLSITGIPTPTRTYTLSGLSSYSLYTITLTARSASNAILAQSNSIVLFTTNLHVHLPIVLKNGP